MAKVIIHRKKKLGGCGQKHEVYLMNKFIGELKNGGTIEFEAGVGYHTLIFNSTMKRMPINAKFNVVINDENEVITLKTYFDSYGRYIVEYDDNKPHIPEFQMAQANSNLAANTTNSRPRIYCPNCGSTNLTPIADISTKGKDFKTGNACCGYFLCGPLGLLCGTAGKGKQVISSASWVCNTCGCRFKL